MTALRILRYAWALPATLLGLAALGACWLAGARVRRVGGTLEVAGGGTARIVARLPRRLRFAAMTLGHVIVGTDHRTLARVRTHERVHVAQYERWGPLFIPLYLASSLVAWLRGRDPYYANRFEREAFAAEALPCNASTVRVPATRTPGP